MKPIVHVCCAATLFVHLARTQTFRPDTAFYVERTVRGKTKAELTLDFSKIRKPASTEVFHPVFHFPPIRQDTTNTCWSFSGISFLESEIFRIHGKKIKLSEMYAVYWEYVEKARRFVREKGDSNFPEGSEHEAVILRIQQYGTVPEEAYTGLLPGRSRHNHDKMVKEMKGYLDYVKTGGIWDEELVLTNIQRIEDRHIGKPPETVTVEGQTLTPTKYAGKVVRLPLADYVNVMSFISVPFYTQGEFDVGDNWWHSKAYYNVPLNEWYGAIKKAIQSGYSVAVGGDVSEPGKSGENGIYIVPGYDLPQERIDQSSREFRFDNKTTQDDHGIHLIGWTRLDGRDWFLIKDSGSSAYRGTFKGYYFFREDAIRLKMLTFMVHRDAVKDLLTKCQPN